MKNSLLTFFSSMALVLFVVGCDTSDTVLLTTELTLEAGSGAQIDVTPSANQFLFLSDNSLIASVSTSGAVSAKVVGETVVKVSSASRKFYDECKIKVTPRYQLCREPYLEFGQGQSEVRAFEKRLLYSDKSEGLAYYGENEKLDAVQYKFQNGQLTSTTLFIRYTVENAQLVQEFMRERYSIDNTGSPSRFQSLDGKYRGLYDRTVQTDGTVHYYIGYFPTTSGRSKSGEQDGLLPSLRPEDLILAKKPKP